MEKKEIKDIWEKFKVDIVYNNRYIHTKNGNFVPGGNYGY